MINLKFIYPASSCSSHVANPLVLTFIHAFPSKHTQRSYKIERRKMKKAIKNENNLLTQHLEISFL